MPFTCGGYVALMLSLYLFMQYLRLAPTVVSKQLRGIVILTRYIV